MKSIINKITAYFFRHPSVLTKHVNPWIISILIVLLLTIFSVVFLIPPVTDFLFESLSVQKPAAVVWDQSFVNSSDDPALPNVLLIGDSISIGYTLPVRSMLNGIANVNRVPDNCSSTDYSLKHIDDWLENKKIDVIYFNWGLHDIRLDGNIREVDIDDYEENLRTLVEKLKKTGARLVWATTTPVPSGGLTTPRDSADVVRYNDVAKMVMNEKDVVISDLYGRVEPYVRFLQLAGSVHFSDYGYAVLALQAAQDIESQLQQ